MTGIEGDIPWALDAVVPGGAAGPAWGAMLADADGALARLAEAVRAVEAAPGDGAAWRATMAIAGPLDDRLGMLVGVATCAHALDVRRAGPLAEARARATRLEALRSRAGAVLAALTATATEAVFDAVEAEDRPLLRRWRSHAPDVLVDGELEDARACTRRYRAAIAELRVEAGADAVPLAAVPALQRGASDPERARLHAEVTRARRSVEPVCREALLGVVGARRLRAEREGVGVLARSLRESRVAEASLDALWAACDAMGPRFCAWLGHRAARLGKARLDWWDLTASEADGEAAPVSWEDACARVVDAFAAFDEEMAAFAVHALAAGWVCRAPGPHARPGAFCITIEAARQSRILLRFSGSGRDVYTLAHELGHAWHAHLLAAEPRGAREAPRALAEVASSFAERLVRERWGGGGTRAVEAAFAKVVLQRIVFDFEVEMADTVRAGPGELDARMEAVQRRHLGDAVAAYSPDNWIGMGRLFEVDGALYSWPHGFGELYAAAVAEHLRGLPAGERAAAWRTILRRTGADSAEDIARDVLGADLAAVGFWERAFAEVRGHLDRLVGVTRAAR